MKAKKAIQQKMYRENSQGYGEQLLEQLYTFLDRFVANGLGETNLEKQCRRHY